MAAILIAANGDLTLPPGTVKLTNRQQISNALLNLTELLATEFNETSDLTIRYRSVRDNEASCNWAQVWLKPRQNFQLKPVAKTNLVSLNPFQVASLNLTT